MDYPISPVPFTAVTFEDGFWRSRLETNRTVTVPYTFKKCEETGRIDNFDKAAGHKAGPFVGIYFNDSDVFKVVEGAAYSLHLHPDPQLDCYLDDLIAKFAAAQEPDGYLYTARTIDPTAVTAEKEGLTRWSNLRVNHELYNVGHMYEAAVAHFQATGKRSFLDVALRNTELIASVFGTEGVQATPGHQEIELGLVKLYRVTGEEKYLGLAKFFLDMRGRADKRELYTRSDYESPSYMQDHLPVVDQREAVGHAVRAAYMYAGMADVAALTGDEGYLNALDALWDNVVSKKLYLTGGIGSRHHDEAFANDYELPNATAYAETCAAIANVMWNYRMFLLHGDAKYIDVLERTLYNGFLSGISLAGDRFFYPNPLESDGKWAFNVQEGATRSSWFDCSCCPTNVVRFMPSLPGYAYASTGDTLFVNLFVAGTSTIQLRDVDVDIVLKTRYPWDGTVNITVTPERTADFSVALRIPGWAQNRPVPSDLYRYLSPQGGQVTLRVNGETADLAIDKGYLHIQRSWRKGDEIELSLPMAVHRVLGHHAVQDTIGKVAVERGPLVYCAEGIDNGGSALDLTLSDDHSLETTFENDLLGGITVIQGEALKLIPYYAWSHRGEGEMAVWLKR